MRAVSSPSLSENPVETTSTVNTCKNDPSSASVAITTDSNQNGAATGVDLHTNGHGSVLQKLKNTLSHLKGSNKSTTGTVSGTAATMNASTDSTTYRFGPLVWRSSKERRKAKHHRRDKCNSGDSGIQVELDPEDMMQTNDSVEASSPSATYTAQVRRANSAKVQSSSSSSVRGKVMRKNESGGHTTTTSPLPGRSLSQPSGLDRIPKG